ncbi:hypothetical protein D3C81_1379660 [compost metagenome]
MRAVRVVGQDRPAGGGALAADDPVVGAEAAAGVAAGVGQCVELVERDAGVLRAAPCVLGEARSGGGQFIGAAQFGGRHRAGVQASAEFGFDRRIELAPDPVGAHGIGPGFAEQTGAIDLAGEVQRQAVVADAHDVFGLPARGLVVELAELGRQQLRLLLGQRHIGVHAGDEGLGHALGVGTVGQPFAVHVAAEQHRARHAVAVGVGGAEVLRHLAEAALAPQVDLPQAVACRHEALHVEGVVKRAGVDMRHAPAVHQHCRGFLQAGNGQAVGARGRLGHGGGDGGRYGDGNQSQRSGKAAGGTSHQVSSVLCLLQMLCSPHRR